MIAVHLSFGRRHGVEIVSSSEPVSPELHRLLVVKSLPLGNPPDEALKSFPLPTGGSAVSFFRVSGETGHGIALVFLERKDVDPFQYENVLRRTLADATGGKPAGALTETKEGDDAPTPSIPRRFESAIHSLLARQKIVVTGDEASVRGMIAFLLSLVPSGFRGLYGVTVWCNSPSEDENIVGLPADLFDKVMPLVETGGEVGAVVDLAGNNTFGRGSTSFSKRLADNIASGDATHVRRRIAHAFSDAVRLPATRKDAEPEEVEVANIVAGWLLGHGAKDDSRSWLDAF